MPCRLPVDLHTFQGILYTKGRYFSMKFKEQSKSLNIPVAREPIIYFLLDGDEVVYIGQSRLGLFRPYSHTDKHFTSVSVIKCQLEELDSLEIFYIRKYLPKYNQKLVDDKHEFSFGKVRRIIRDQTDFKNCTVFHIRKMVKVMKINTFSIQDTFYMTSDDAEKIIDYVNSHYDGHELKVS